MWIDFRHINLIRKSKRNFHLSVNSKQKLITDTEIFKTFPKGNKPSDYEKIVLEEWKSLSKAKVKIDESKKYVSMLLPPPNITGNLHLGHFLTVSIQDILSRWYQMQGYEVVWIPGTDHAGIATQVIVEKQLAQQGLSRYEIGREKFVEKIQQWKQTKGNHIMDQLHNMGLTLDWSRQYFTMDEKQSFAVREAIIRLFEQGLIYRDETLVNWCCTLKSTISDIEVEHISLEGKQDMKIPGYNNLVTFGQIYDFAYKIHNTSEEVIVSTTRPETILGDVAIAVNPNDERYSQLREVFFDHPFNGRKIPLVFDESVDASFGTGAMKVTPAHDRTDYDIAKRHNLKLIQIFDEGGTLNENCSDYKGMKRFDARRQIVQDLAHLGLLKDVKNHAMSVPTCSRTGDVVELLIKPQWFIKCKEMSQSCLKSVQNKSLKIDSDMHIPSWNIWFENIRDWCISRQLWWGHRIPLYQCDKGWVAAHNIEDARLKAFSKWGESEISFVKQDEDVLDTWFSSALLPFSTLGWPNQTDSKEYKQLYPLTLMETGHDILNFWVARMVMLGLHLTGKLPFSKVFLHGMVCDSRGRKMSKSLGNTIEPENIVQGIKLAQLNEILKSNFKSGLISEEEYKNGVKTQKSLYPNGIEECGIDALRFTLCFQNIKSLNVNFDTTTCEVHKRFGNKILNLTKFGCCHAEILDIHEILPPNQLKALSFAEKWILSRLAHTTYYVNSGLTNVDIHVATRNLKTFLYGNLCDVFVELSKSLLNSPDEATRLSAGHTLLTTIEASLRLISPFMPFLTHLLYKYIPNCANQQLIVSQTTFPTSDEWEMWRNPKLEKEMDLVLELVTAMRRITLINNISSKIADIVIISDHHDTISQYLSVIESLIKFKSILITSERTRLRKEGVFNLSDTVGDHTSVHVIVKNEEMNLTQHEKLMRDKRDRIKREIEKVHKKTLGKDGPKTLPDHVREGIENKLNSLNEELSRVQAFLDLAKNACKIRRENENQSISNQKNS